MKGSAIVVGLVCLLVGLAIGGLGVYALGPLIPRTGDPYEDNPLVQRPGMAGPPPGMGGGPQAPNYKAQLTGLVGKLDRITEKPLTITLSEEQRAKLREQLAGLEAMDELKDDEAKNRLEAVLDIVKGDKETLVAAGYRWPDSGGGGPGGGPGGGAATPPPPNPFKEKSNADHLKALQERLAKGKPD